MVNIIGIASSLGYLDIPDNTLIDVNDIRNYPDNKICLITTGSQGETMAALSRMANGIHRKVQITPNDVVVFSSHPIPGNEKSVSGIMNELIAKGAEIVNQDVHVSGHACAEDIKLIYSLVKPTYSVPVHGEIKHRMAQGRLAQAVGVPKDHVLMIQTGDVLEINEDFHKVVGKVQTGAVMVDGLGVGDVGNIVLRDRQKLAEDGIIIVAMTMDSASGEIVAGPDLVSRGFVYVRGAEDLMEDARAVLNATVRKCEEDGISDWAEIKNQIKDALSAFVWKQTQRSPMILPIIMEV